ncbi:hypothetical protein ZWY2020_018873 [Hordeum vulgare]|nr:hypothetical protein ZWY2020_018873 [Hordeum vulgare]
MKLYFLLPGKEIINGLVFLYDDSGCVKMADYICVGGVADVYVEYHGEEDNDSSSGSDYEDEIIEESDNCSGDEPDEVITAVEPAESDTDVLIPDETGVITQRLCSPMKQRRSSIGQVGVDHDEMPVIEANQRNICCSWLIWCSKKQVKTSKKEVCYCCSWLIWCIYYKRDKIWS